MTDLSKIQTIAEKESLSTDMAVGLSAEQVETLRQYYGLNEVKEKQTPAFVLLARKFWGLTAWMLEATIIISFLLHKTFDGFLITVLLIFNGLISFFNELKAAKTVAALQQQLQVMVRVLRRGTWQQLPSKELVPGDVVRVRMGDFLTADMQLADGEIKVDKSALTGETALLSVKKSELLYAGSVVKAGEGTAIVTATGTQTFFGKTAKLVMTASHKMHMEEVVTRVVKFLFIAVVSILTITTIVGLIAGQTIISILPLILILLVSAVPVGLPAMFTISMARGSKELSEDGLLVSRLSATEDAATLTTLCIDKTGTITKNELSLQQIIATDGYSDEDVIQYGVMASVKANEDTIDLAFFDFADKQPSFKTQTYQQISFTPFNASIKHTEAVIERNNQKFSVAKGAYTAIKNLCGIAVSSMDGTVNEWAHKGFKTIAVAVAKSNNVFAMAGIVALYDPPRPDAKEMLAAIKDLGIDVKMLTGDALPIGKEIAQQAGIGSNIISIAEVREQFDTSTSIAVIHEHNGFAEVLPEDKFSIVKQLQQEKQVVGMTGDGVNDAPALKQAEVGIAVKNATDVAKQAASIILLTEGLQQILSLIKVGRSIHVRISNYTVNKIAKTIQTILFVCVSFIITKQFVVATIDMVLMLFLIDFAVLALATDKVSWSRKPANWNIKPLVVKGVLLGVLLFAECIAWYFAAKNYFTIQDTGSLHSLGFACLFFSGIISILVIRTEKRFFKEPVSKLLSAVILADIIVVCILLTIGFTGFSKLPLIVILSTLLFFVIVNLLVNDTVKIVMTKSYQKNNL
ncbi:MAG: plasma-membrane proton-efflux P-type ATPase [Bacteroidota bacterium]